MSGIITTKIFRYDPDIDSSPYFKEYTIPSSEEISVLTLLNVIQSNIDSTLSYRSYCCGLQMCRSCLIKINHKKAFACLTLVKPGDVVTLEPVNFPELHVKDLVIKLDKST